MNLRRYVTTIGFLAAAIGFILLFVPVSTVRTGACGTVADPDTIGAAIMGAYTGQYDAGGLCDDALSTRRGWVFGLMAVGVVIGTGAIIAGRRSAQPPASGPAPA